MCSEAQTSCRDAQELRHDLIGAQAVYKRFGVTCLLASHQRAVLASNPFAPSDFVLGLRG